MALNDIQKLVISTLAESPLQKRFYWTGGTLLAEKYLAHRRSYDVDLFSDNPFRYQDILPLIHTLKQKTALSRVEEKKVFDRWEFFLHNGSELRVEFVHYDFGHLKERSEWQGVLIDSLDDLAANKVMALVERHEPKDAVDIYFLAKQKRYTPARLLELAQAKFELSVGEDTLISQALVACKNLKNIEPMLYGEEEVQKQTINDIQDYFQQLSRKYLSRYLQ